VSLEAGQSASYVSKLESYLIVPSFSAFSRLVSVLSFTSAEVALVVALEAQRGSEMNEGVE
jgi:predicted transcriptional regulator